MSYPGSVMVYEKFLRAGVGAVGETGEVEGASVGRGSLARRAEVECDDAPVRSGSVAGTCSWSGRASEEAVATRCGC